jgi:signal transduction histidine kinase
VYQSDITLLNIFATIADNIKSEGAAFITRLRTPRIWRAFATVSLLLFITTFLELAFLGGSTPLDKTSNSLDKIAQEALRRIKESERLVTSTRDNLAKDTALIETLKSKDRKRILLDIARRDSVLNIETSAKKSSYLQSELLAFALYDSSSTLQGWNQGASKIQDIETEFAPPFDVSNRVKGIFFESTPSKQYLTAFHKLFDATNRYVGYVVIKLFIGDEDINYETLASDRHRDLFADIEKKEHLVLALANSKIGFLDETPILLTRPYALEEGGPLSTINLYLTEEINTTSIPSEWNIISALRDFLSIVIISILLFTLFSIQGRSGTDGRQRHTAYQVLLMVTYTLAARYILYLVGSGVHLFPESMSLVSDYAYQGIDIISNARELFLSSYFCCTLFIALFLHITSELVTPKGARSQLNLLTVYLLTLLAIIVVIDEAAAIVVNNCSFSLGDALIPVLPAKYLFPLVSLFILTTSILMLSVGIASKLISLLHNLISSRQLANIGVLACVICLVVIAMIIDNQHSITGVLTTSIGFGFAALSMTRLRFTPKGYRLTRSPIAALTIATLGCFVLAPRILSLTSAKEKESISASILAKAGFQFSVAGMQLPESLHSVRSYFSNDTISSRKLLPLILLKETQRLRSEIPGTQILLQIRSSGDSVLYSSGSITSTPNDSLEVIREDRKLFVLDSQGDSTMRAERILLSAFIENDLLDIGSNSNASFVSVYNNDKLERSTISNISVPPSLAAKFKYGAAKGTWSNIEIDGKDVSVFAKSIFNFGAAIGEKVLVAGITNYSLGDIFVYGIRYSTLALSITAIVILLTLTLTSKVSLARFTLRFRERIFLIIFIIALVPLVFISNITRTILQSRESEDQRRELITEADKISNIVRPILSDSTRLERMPFLLGNLSRTLEHRVDVFSGDGILLASSAQELYDANLLPRLLPIDILLPLIEGERTSQYVETISDDEKTTSSYQTVYDKTFTNLLGTIAVTRNDNISRSENEIASTTSIIYGTFSLVGLLLLIIGSYVSYRVASPLHEIITATEKVARGEFGTQVAIIRKDEIGDLASAFNKMTEELDASRDRVAQSEREGAWKEMARQVAHEIKNPLTPMKLSVQHVQHAYEVKDTNFTTVFNRVMKTLSEQIDVLTRIATEFSRFGEMPRRRYGFVSLKRVVDSAVALFDAERAHIRFVVDIPEKISAIYADEEEFRRTLVNLIRNAVQAMDGWGAIVVSAEENAGIIHLAIKDTGAGMSEDTLRKAFDPNFSTKTSGMGLGLAIVKRTITDMSGTIRVVSTLGKGTTFHIELPARDV